MMNPSTEKNGREHCQEVESRRHPYLSGNFAPTTQTTPLTPCSFTGTIPPDLGGGQYVRNGGNPVTNADLGRDAHWFDGDGMLSGVLFRKTGEKGSVIQPEFVNQFLVTDVYAYAYARQTGAAALRRPVLPSISTLVNPAASVVTIVWAVLRTLLLVLLSHLSRTRYPIKKISVANTAVIYHDGRALALCESGPPLRFALPGLETIGWFNGRTAENEPYRQNRSAGFGGDRSLTRFMKEWTTAHPRVDPVTKEMLAFHAVFLPPFCFYSIVPSDSSRGSSRGSSSNKTSPGSTNIPPARFSLPVPGVSSPKMMHDFGASRLHTVILDLPLTLDPINLARGVPVLSYDSTGVSRFGVFPRYEPHRIQWFETNPCVIFHTANTWDTVTNTTTMTTTTGGSIFHPQTSVHLLACRLTSASLVFSAGNLPTPAVQPVPPEYAEEEQCRLYYYQFSMTPPEAAADDADDADDVDDDHDRDRDHKPVPAHHRIRHQWALSAIPFEFPTIAPTRAMQPARFVYGCSTTSASYTVALGKAAQIAYLVKMDVAALIARGEARPPQPVRGCVDARSLAQILAADDPLDPIRLFALPPGWYAQEPRFVPRRRPKAEAEAEEDDGWLLTYVFDEAQLDADGECREGAVSELWVIDARSMREVVARVRLPQRVPYGLHGAWFSEDEVSSQRPFAALRTLERQADPEAGAEEDGLALGRLVRRALESWIG